MAIGEVLRDTREAKGISPAEVEDRIKIRRKYIIALENEDFDVLPGKVYVKGFLRSYARLLELDGEALVREYEERFDRQTEPEPLPRKTPTKFEKPSGFRRVMVTFVAFLVLGGLLIWWNHAGTAPGDNIAGGGHQQNIPPGEDPQDRDQGPTSEPGGMDPAGDNGVEPVQSGVDMVLEVTDSECWMLVVVDDQSAFEGLVRPGNTKEFRGDQSIWLKLGDAGSVRVKVNGNDYGYLGGDGDVVTRIFKAGENS